MNSLIKSILWIGLLLFFGGAPVHAQDNAARELAEHCKVELETHCHDVTPGRGRIVSCLYAYSDKLSHKCKQVVMDAAEYLKLVSSAISYVQSECSDDLEQFCKDVPPGEGRLLNCLEKNDTHVSQKCKLALKEVGLRK